MNRIWIMPLAQVPRPGRINGNEDDEAVAGIVSRPHLLYGPLG